MTSFYNYILYLTIFCNFSVLVNCNKLICDTDADIDKPSGTLIIYRKPNFSCGFTVKQSIVLKFNTQDLSNGDNITIDNLNGPDFLFQKSNSSGSIQNGLLVVSPRAMIKFEFGSERSDRIISIEYNPTSNITFTEPDNDQTFLIYDVQKGYEKNATQIDLNFSLKSSNIYIRLVGTNIPEILPDSKYDFLKSGFILTKESNALVKLRSNLTSYIYMTKKPALKSCSFSHINVDTEISVTIKGPGKLKRPESYTCVNLFSLAPRKPKAQFKVDFKNFIGLSDDEDKLSVYGSDPTFNLAMTRINSELYVNKVEYIQSQQLAVIYESDEKIRPNDIDFIAQVSTLFYGGYLNSNATLILPPTATPVTFFLHPNYNQTGAVAFGVRNLGDVEMSITFNDATITFGPGRNLPPLISNNEPNRDIILQFSTTKSYQSLKDQITFISSPNSCHKTSFTSQDSFSVIGKNYTQECYWTILFNAPTNVQPLYNQLANDSCIDFDDTSYPKPIFEQCGLSRKTLLPNFILNSAGEPSYVKVTSKSMNDRLLLLYVDAADLFAKTKQIKAKGQFEVTSIGYPLSYSFIKYSQNYNISTSNNSYIISPHDVNIRKGEVIDINGYQLNSDDYQIKGDIVVQNLTYIPIMIKRETLGDDYSIQRGYYLIGNQYDKIYTLDVVNTTKSNFKTGKNLTSIAVKLKSTLKKTNFSGRIAITISPTSSSNNKDYQVTLTDGNYVQSINHTFHDSTKNETTSNTATITVKLASGAKPNATLPEFNLEYYLVPCNETSDLLCDHDTRCVPRSALCLGNAYCDDGTDLKIVCAYTGPIAPKIIQTGASGFAIFVLCIFMVAFGVFSTLYGPNFLKYIETRVRSRQYSSFSAVE